MSAEMPPAGWYNDPEGDGLRWWDGSQWTEHRRLQSPASIADRLEEREGAVPVVPMPHPEPSKGAKIALVVLAILGIGLIGNIFGLGSSSSSHSASNKPASQSMSYEEELEEAHDVVCSHAPWKWEPECQ